MSEYNNAILFYNTESGHSKKGRQLDQIKAHFTKHDISLTIIEFPVPGEDIKETVNKADSEQANLIIDKAEKVL
jgi:diacylglycerol kinase family enzyme